ncbi:MAG TPA: hypothetical protein VFL96_08520, partial [Acidobacteriaceae bacterium]|nr:hypothetical protein [Acidobacteriaceae bacterium]
MTPLLLLFGSGFVSWTLSTVSAGGGSVLFVALLSVILSGRAVAPVVTIASFIAGPARMVMFWSSIN